MTICLPVVFSWLTTTGKQLDVDATFLSFEWDYFEIIRQKMLDLLYERCFFLWLNDWKATRNYCIFWIKKLKLRPKQVIIRLLFCVMLWKTICIYNARFRFRREIHDQLPPLERFLETISSIWCNLWNFS